MIILLIPLNLIHAEDWVKDVYSDGIWYKNLSQITLPTETELLEQQINLTIINLTAYTQAELNNKVDRIGDRMTGNLNMTDNNILDVNILYVHNISGRSPIYITGGAVIIENNSVTADNFYGNFIGNNGTITDVIITNLTLDNLVVINPNASFTGDLLPTLNNTYSLGSQDFLWKDFYVNNLIVSNITTPSITYILNELNNKLNTTDQRYNDTILINTVNNSLYLYNDTLKIDAVNNSLYLYNNTILTYTLNIFTPPVNTNLTYITQIISGYKITKIKVIPSNLSNTYNFQAVENTTEIMIDRNRIQHLGEWNIEKAHSISNDALKLDIINALINDTFNIQITYNNNEAS